MITLTERAATEMQEILATRGAAPGEGMRIVPVSGGFDLRIGPPADGDEVVRRGDTPLLIVEESIAPVLDGAVIDVADPDSAGGARRFRLIPAEQR
jgi:Fe-S cluster assembly iron-binding protein IscA